MRGPPTKFAHADTYLLTEIHWKLNSADILGDGADQAKVAGPPGGGGRA